MIGTAKKNYTVWHFDLFRTPGNEFAGQFTRQQMRYIAYFMKTFLLKKKFLPPVDPVGFFKTFLLEAPVMFRKTEPSI